MLKEAIMPHESALRGMFYVYNLKLLKSYIKPYPQVADGSAGLGRRGGNPGRAPALLSPGNVA
jgi:hypothetical protein